MPSLDAFLHVEIVHPDPDAAAEVLIRRFGGERVEERLAEGIEERVPGCRCVHVMAGPVVFQLLSVPADLVMTAWAEQLEAQGPSIFCLAFRVDDYKSARDALLEEGAEMTAEYTADFSDIGLGDGPYDACVVDTRELLGFQLELVDPSTRWEPGKAP
jgi:hypothetical protein